MKLTPLDIKKQTFRKVMRGLDPEEVRSYLDMLAEDWGAMRDEVRRLQEKQREDAAKLEHYTRVEEALQEALRTARESARRAIANAERKAELLVQAAEQEADAVKSAAVRERHQIRRETKTLVTRRDEVAARLRAFLQSELELLTRFDEAREAERSASSEAAAPEPVEAAVSDSQPEPEASAPAAPAAPDAHRAESEHVPSPQPEQPESAEPVAPPAAPGFRVQPLVGESDTVSHDDDGTPMASEEEMRQIRALMQDLD